jgi:predicted TIM-barrel fold metal-dependent hydrolase
MEGRRLVEFYDCDILVGRRNIVPSDSFWETEKILAAMGRFNITGALIYHTVSEDGDAQRGNAMVAREAGSAECFTASWAVGPPIAGEWPKPRKLVQELIRSGARAARLFPAPHLFPLSVFMLDDLLAELERRRVPLLVHASTVHPWTDFTDWHGLQEICTQFPRLPVVAMRVGLRTTRPLYRMLEKLPNFHFELSAFSCNYRGLEDMVRHFGADRILYGSIMPAYSPSIPVAQILYADISSKAKRHIAGENLHRLIGRVDI